MEVTVGENLVSNVLGTCFDERCLLCFLESQIEMRLLASVMGVNKILEACSHEKANKSRHLDS